MICYKRAKVPTACLPGTLVSNVDYDADLDPALTVDIWVVDRTIAKVTLSESEPVDSGVKVVDLGGHFVWPGMVDAHMHLDKAHTWNRAPNRRGEFWDAIELLTADKEHWSEEDVYRRANYTLECAWQHGVSAIRTHLDTSADFGASSHHVIAKLRSEWADRIAIQTVCLTGVEDFVDLGFADQMGQLLVETGGTAIGGMPQMSDTLDAELDALFETAKRFQLPVDLHVDESGDPSAECLKHVALAVMRNEFTLPVTCGHCCSLAVQSPERQKATLKLVAEAGIHVISLPMCNLFLQDRMRENKERQEALGIEGPGTPFWRGITLVQELQQSGVLVAAASDNVRDAFYAFGDGDTFESYITMLRAGHLDLCLEQSPAFVTTHAADIMGLDQVGRIESGAVANLVVFDGIKNFSQLLSRTGASRTRIFGKDMWSRALPDYPDF
ncbi:MAG: cytosine deaminase [Verrucomicrobiota bacterium]